MKSALCDALGSIHRQNLRRAEIFDTRNSAPQVRGRIESDMFGPDSKEKIVCGEAFAHFGDWHLGTIDLHAFVAGSQFTVKLQKAHGRRTNEIRHKDRRRFVVNFLRRAELFHHALVHDRNSVGHGHRLHLIVRDIHRRRVDAIV